MDATSPRGRLVELLWPEADGDLADHSFEVALSRLRKILGNEEALASRRGAFPFRTVNAGSTSGPSRGPWGRRRRRGRRGRGRKRSVCSRRHVPIQGSLPSVRGNDLHPFAAGKAAPRTCGPVALLGQCYEDCERWEEAVSCYGKGIEVDNLAEELYRRLMVCDIRQGKEAEALSVYLRCRKTLSSVLGVEPSARLGPSPPRSAVPQPDPFAGTPPAGASAYVTFLAKFARPPPLTVPPNRCVTREPPGATLVTRLDDRARSSAFRRSTTRSGEPWTVTSSASIAVEAGSPES